MGCQSQKLIQKRDDLSVRRQCSLLGINRATLYYKGKEPDEAARLFRERVMARIDYWHTRMPAIGSRKIAVLLWKEGLDAGRKMIRNCMAEMGISAIYPKANLSKRNFKQAIVSDYPPKPGMVGGYHLYQNVSQPYVSHCSY